MNEIVWAIADDRTTILHDMLESAMSSGMAMLWSGKYQWL